MKQGDLVGQKYKVIQELAQGGTSSVYLAESIALKNLWIIKAISRHSAFLTNEMQEVHILKTLNHPMLPRVADLIEDDQSVYIVMDYLEGETLSQILSRETALAEVKVFDYAKQLCDVLFYLHAQRPDPVIYRDLKPSNIILDKNGRLHLVDFGAARTFKEDKQDDTVYIGTYGYAAPEQFGSGRSDERTDLYNLGMTLLHLLTGIHPTRIGADAVASVLQKRRVSKEFTNIIIGLVQHQPDHRIGSVTECLNRLNAIGKKKMQQKPTRTQSKGLKLAIGLMGIDRGVGTTLVGIGLAALMTQRGHQAAYIELNDSGSMGRLERAFFEDDHMPDDDNKGFEAEGITFYKSVSDITMVPRKGFDVLIMDFGCSLKERVFQEFNRCDIRLMICSGMDWKLSQAADFKQAFQVMDPHGEWIYIITPALPTDEKRIQKLLDNQNALTFPMIRNLFGLDRQEQKHMEATLNKIMERIGLKCALT